MNAEPVPGFDEEKMVEARLAWCRAYVHVWADLSRGVYDKDAIARAADEHWQRSPQSDPVQVATLAFTR